MRKNNDIINFIHDSLVRVEARLDDMESIQIRHEENLKEHMRRSDAAEKGILALVQEIEPLKKQKNYIDAGLKILGAIAAVSVFVLTVLEIVSKIK